VVGPTRDHPFRAPRSCVAITACVTEMQALLRIRLSIE
jgi:hypothetical protein